MSRLCSSNSRGNVRVVAADDSAFMRHMLTTLFATMAQHEDNDASRLELVAVVEDGEACVEAVRRLQPDIVLLDLEMPRMGGMDALDILQREFPAIHVVMCSASTERGAAATLDALARGATDYITKPSTRESAMAATASLSAQLALKLGALAGQVLSRVQVAGSALRARPEGKVAGCSDEGKRSAAGSGRVARQSGIEADLIGIGVSTGGPAALEKILPQLPKHFAVPVVIVQHMPKLFTQALAERLDRVCTLRVREAAHHCRLEPGTVWLAPGDRHMQVQGDAGEARLVLHDREPLLHCRPSVNYLFQSMARDYSGASLAVVLTGMGSDGLDGARELAAAGGTVIAQDQASSAVWGMPGRVTAAGLASAVLAVEQIAPFLCSNVRRPVHARGTGRREEPMYAL